MSDEQTATSGDSTFGIRWSTSRPFLNALLYSAAFRLKQYLVDKSDLQSVLQKKKVIQFAGDHTVAFPTGFNYLDSSKYKCANRDRKSVV